MEKENTVSTGNDYAEKIKQLRMNMNMNRVEFCEYYGIPYRTVQDWEAGKRSLPDYVYRLMLYKFETDYNVKK